MFQENCDQKLGWPKKLFRLLDSLYSIVEPLSVHYGQHQLLSKVLGALERELGFHRCTVMLLSPYGDKLVFGADSRADFSEQEISYSMGEGVSGKVLETGKAKIIPCISEEPDFCGRVHKRHSTERTNAGFVCLPIMLNDKVVGTLAADIPYSTTITIDNSYRLLQIISHIIAHDVQFRREVRSQCEFLEKENERLRNEIKNSSLCLADFKSNSNVMDDVFRRIKQVASSNTTVLIRGESGTGKELVAEALHNSSSRASKPFVKINCAALSDNLLESELFGHEKGSFTGAFQTHIGLIERAEGGTLFLDEIGDISPALQVKLLRVLQEHEYQRVGSNETCYADVRVITATNRDLEAARANKEFREDLYFRINVFPIYVPPLRERKSDIMILADHFIIKFSKELGKAIHRISTSAINTMYAYHWPGNVRELENCIEHAVLMSRDGVIHAYDLPPSLQKPSISDSSTSTTLNEFVNIFERDLIIDAIKRNDGNVSAAARQLGLTPRMMRYKIEKLEINYKLFRHRNS